MSSIRISSSSSSLAAAAVKKAQPIAWSHQETLNLIEAYKEKWYSVERGPLKGSQWEEVAVTVSLRCGYEDAHPSEKRGIQCRHKMEKLRKRYRAEKKTGRKSCWVYYDVMECLERGPMPVSARPLTENLEEDEEEEEEEEDEEDEEEEEEEDEEEEMGVRVAAEVREFARRLVRMEKRKMNMMRQSQTWRVQMENKRIQMILDSHTKIIDIIATTFAPPPPPH